MKRWLNFLLALSLLGPAWNTLAAGLIVIETPTEETRILPPPHPIPPRPVPLPRPIPAPRPYIFAPLELTSHQVNVRINDQVARTAIEEEFYNPNNARLEGTFLFPVPRGAQINKFTMEIGGKPVEAELLSADKARRIYEDIVRKMRDPALLEYADRDLFKVRIFPIEPHERKHITLAYTEVLKMDNGLIGYTYPLNTQKYSAAPVKTVSLKVELESKRPLKTIYSPTHDVEVRRNGDRKATVGFEASNVRNDTDFQLFFAPEKDDIGLSLLTYRTGEGEGYFLLLASPGTLEKQKQSMPKDVVFVLDTSGSMAGKKLEQAKKALRFCVENLNEEDRFEIIRFSTDTEPLFQKLAEANPANRKQAQEFIDGLKPIGGTAIYNALQDALSRRPEKPDRPLVIVFLTDGLPTIGITSEEKIVADVNKENSANTRIFCFGIGTDVNTHLLDRIAEKTKAFSQYVLPEEDIEVKVSNFFGKIKDPVLANPQLSISKVRINKTYPMPLPDLFKGEQLIVAGRYSGSGHCAVELSGTINGKTQNYVYEVTFPEQAGEHDFIPRLWATRRVGYLLDEIRLHGETAELKDEVTDLARTYGIVTPYTAYLIIEDEKRKEVPLAMQSLRQLQTDGEARERLADGWRKSNADKSGDAAVAGARFGLELKAAATPSGAIAKSSEEAKRSYSLLSPGFSGRSAGATTTLAREAAVRRIDEYAEQNRFVAGKTFYQNEKQWIDTDTQKMQQAKRVRVQFNSKEYFELAAKEPRALRWLSLGQNVQFVIGDTVYEVYE